jgi:hypothetical protein
VALFFDIGEMFFLLAALSTKYLKEQEKIMKKTTLLIAATAVLIAMISGCSSNTNQSGTATAPAKSDKPKANFTGNITVTYKEAGDTISRELAVKQGMVAPLAIASRMGGAEVNGTTYEFYIGSHEFEPVMSPARQPNKDGDIGVKFEIICEKGQPVKAGTYPVAGPKDGANIVGKTRSVYIDDFVNGKPKSLGLTADYPRGERKGQVKIDSVEGDMISGEIDMADDFGSVKGKFTAQLVGKK